MVKQFLFDSAFANGAYSHSFGLESYIAWGCIKDSTSYQAWLEHYMMNVFATSDGAIYVIASKLKDKKLSLLKLARVSVASISSSESRAASISMARATLKNTEFMHSELATWYYSICEKNELFAHPAIAFALLNNDMNSEYAYSTIKTLTQNATRAIPLSYKKSSELLYLNTRLAEKSLVKSQEIAKDVLRDNYFSLLNLDSELSRTLFSTHQELDMAMYAHERLDFRLFMS